MSEQTQTEQLRTFLSLGRQLSAAATAEAAARIIVGVADELLGWDACSLDFYSPEQDSLTPILTIDLIDGRRTDVPPAYSGPPSLLVRQVIEEGARLFLRPETPTPAAALQSFGDTARPSASLMFVPIRHGQQVNGILSIQSYTPHAYSQQSLELLQALADYCGGAFHRIQAESAWRASEERFYKAFQANPLALGITSLVSGRLIDVNETAVRLSGYRRDEIIGRTSRELNLWSDWNYQDQIGQALEKGQSVHDLPMQARTKSGELRDVLASFVKIELAGEPCVLSLLQDVTARRQAEERLQQIVDTVPDGVLLLNHEGRVVMANPAAQEYLPLLGNGGVGEKLPTLRSELLAVLLAALPGGDAWQEVELKEQRRTFEVAARPIRGGGQESGWVVVLRDVTQARKQEQYGQAQERLAVVGQLAAGIAHDFNNIMAIIVLYATMLLKADHLSAKDQERLTTIYQQAQRAGHLIQQILDFSRQSVIERAPFSLLPFLKELVKLLERTLPETINLELVYPAGEFIINGDPTRLQQTIMNLAVNARDAMPAGGRLRILLRALSVAPGKPPPLPDMFPGDWFELQVSDTGTGIPFQDLPHIFEPFFTTKPPGQGTGLGLAQVYGIVKQHDGFIDVASQPGQGTVFTIYLPALPAVAAQGPAPALEAQEGSGQTILVVEDDPGARLALAEVLEMLNYQVLAAANGQEALAIFEKCQGEIALVVSDLVMPGVDGATLHKRLKAQKADLKMLVTTGYPLEGAGRELVEQGHVAWLQKPFEVSQIAEAIREALES
ncbi:MAG: PAS domain S-box protein [Chloroflexi bacterium]|nr:PAS domain S-box protein [Chloroflexota bacterium]